MKPSLLRFGLLLVSAIIPTALHAQSQESFASETIRQRVNLMPIEEPERAARDFRMQSLADMPEGERNLFLQKDDGAWKTYSDDVISFEHPDDPLFKIAAITPESNEPIRIVGGSVGSADRSFERAYRLTVNRWPYVAIFVREAEWFDDGICFCGSINLNRWIATDGNLLQFGFLRDGNMKKAEVLGGKLRAIMLEWTHSSIPQEAYARIGRSLRLKDRSPRTPAEWMLQMNEKTPQEETFGWLEPGDDAARVRKIVGEPTKVEGDTWIYVDESRSVSGSGWRRTVHFPMRNGRFERFETGWSKGEELEPLRGRLKWASNQLDSSEKKISKADAREIFDAFIHDAEANQLENWSNWCQVASRLVERGFRDKRVEEMVRKSFLDLERYQDNAADLLDELKAKGRHDLYVQRAQLLLESQTEWEKRPLSDLYSLFRVVEPKNPKAATLVRTALKHPSPQARQAGLNWADRLLPSGESRTAIIAGMDDTAKAVQETAIERFAKIATSNDLDLLRQIRDKCTDEWRKTQLTKTINEFEKAPGSNAKVGR